MESCQLSSLFYLRCKFSRAQAQNAQKQAKISRPLIIWSKHVDLRETLFFKFVFLLCLGLTNWCHQTPTLNKLKQTGTKAYTVGSDASQHHAQRIGGYRQWEATSTAIPKATGRFRLQLDTHTSRIWRLTGINDFCKVKGRHAINLYSMAGCILKIVQSCKISLIAYHEMNIQQIHMRTCVSNMAYHSKLN